MASVSLASFHGVAGQESALVRGERVATGLLAVASIAALGAAGTQVSVAAIAVLTPVVLAFAVLVTRDR